MDKPIKIRIHKHPRNGIRTRQKNIRKIRIKRKHNNKKITKHLPKIPTRRPHPMNTHQFKQYCITYIRYSAILKHLNHKNAPYTERYSIIKEMENITEKMKKELKQ